MPTLVPRSDGAYVVLHSYRGQYQTWQITGEGVRFLQRYGVRDHDSFDLELFGMLHAFGMVYTGTHPPSR